MVNKATVTTKRPAVGVEFTPALFQDAITPDVIFDELDLSTVDFNNAELNNVKINGAEFSGTITGLTGQGASNLDDLTDVESINPEDLSALQYNASRNLWEAVPTNEFVDGLIDGGHADTIHLEILDIDGGGA